MDGKREIAWEDDGRRAGLSICEGVLYVPQSSHCYIIQFLVHNLHISTKCVSRSNRWNAAKNNHHTWCHGVLGLLQRWLSNLSVSDCCNWVLILYWDETFSQIALCVLKSQNYKTAAKHASLYHIICHFFRIICIGCAAPMVGCRCLPVRLGRRCVMLPAPAYKQSRHWLAVQRFRVTSDLICVGPRPIKRDDGAVE